MEIRIKDRNHAIALGALCALMFVAIMIARTILIINSISKI